jgi:hypothetical protein
VDTVLVGVGAVGSRVVGVKAFRGVGAGVGTGFLTVGTGFFTVTLGAGFLTVGTGFLTVALGAGFLTVGLGTGFLTVTLGLAAHRWCNVQIVRQGWLVSGCPPLSTSNTQHCT